MQPPQHAAQGEGVVVLREDDGVADGLIEASLVPAFKEPATFVSEHSGSDQQRAVQPLTLLAGELFNLHGQASQGCSVAPHGR